MAGDEMTTTAVGASHKGRVREHNEDRMVIDEALGLYAVFDGMGGHNAGEVASRMAADVVCAHLRVNASRRSPQRRLEAAFQAASAAICNEAARDPERAGMGTTAIACLIAGKVATVAHVGDSRAYLVNHSGVHQLTRDHTIVADLIAKGQISVAEAEYHPARSVLSRNLGALPRTRVDTRQVTLEPGDRLLLCSDGLTGYAPLDAISRTAMHAPASAVASDLVQLALRCGGGDNVTVIAVTAGEPRPAREVAGAALESMWRGRRAGFLAAAELGGLADSPICAILSPEEAIAIVAGNFFDAVAADLERGGLAHVWSFAENLASGWLDQDAGLDLVRGVLDIAATAAEDASRDEPPLCIAVLRLLAAAEMAVGSQIADRMAHASAALVAARKSEDAAFSDHPTIPAYSARDSAPSPEVTACLTAAREVAHQALPDLGLATDASECIDFAHELASDAPGADPAVFCPALFGTRRLSETELSPLCDVLDRARAAHMRAVRDHHASPEVRCAALRRVAAAHSALFAGVGVIACDAMAPITTSLQELLDETRAMRAELRDNEASLLALGREIAALGDPDLEPADGDTVVTR